MYIKLIILLSLISRESSGESGNLVGGQLTSAGCSLPPHWSSMQEEDTFIRVKLHPSSDEYRSVAHSFHRCLKEDQAAIVGIECVQNPFMWEKYSRYRDWSNVCHPSQTDFL